MIVTIPDLKTERKYIQEQYKSKDNLHIRIETHEKYTEPKIDFHDWILDHIDWVGSETVLDLGCGTGSYGEPVSKRCRRYLAGDLSIGMLQSLHIDAWGRVNFNAESIPFEDSIADVVLANHMLYHVQRLPKALQGIRRILKPAGFLIAATNSGSYMPELQELLLRLARRFGLEDLLPNNSNVVLKRFTLENGHEVLEPIFRSVQRFDLKGALVFHEPEPLVDYLSTMKRRYTRVLPAEVRWEQIASILTDEIGRDIEQQGEFRVSKLAGVFVCS
jgi:SAM-dependent methyltransferase